MQEHENQEFRTDAFCCLEKTEKGEKLKEGGKKMYLILYLFLLMLPASDDRMLSPSSSSLLRSSLFFAYKNRSTDR